MEILRLVGAMTFAAALCSAAHAAVVTIDEFSTDQVEVIGSNGDADNEAASGVGLLGGVREVTLSNTDATNAPLDTIFVASNGIGRFESGASSNGTGITSSFRLDFDGTADSGFDPTGLGSTDLIDGTNDTFWLASNFVDGISDIRIQVWDGDSTALSSILSINAAGQYFIPFTEFGGIDFTDIAAISVFIDSQTPAADLNLDYIRAAGRDDVIVPIPGAAFLFFPAIVGLAVARRRRK